MKISFVLKESRYDCKIQITDLAGNCHYMVSASNGNNISEKYVVADVYGDEFDVTLIPIMPDTESMLDGFGEQNTKGKLAEKAKKYLVSALNNMTLNVACTYHIDGLQDGDRLDITLQKYVFGRFDRFDLLDLIPMVYMFFEISSFTNRLPLINAQSTNRKDVVKMARVLSFSEVLGNSLLVSVITYPLQMSRIKLLSKNKKIFQTLKRFNNLSETERQKTIDKQDEFFDI